MKNYKRVVHHMQIFDVLLIVVPMILTPLAITINALLTAQGAMAEAIMLGSLVLIFIFWLTYGFTAFVLLLVMRRNSTFRISLAAGFILILAAPFLLMESGIL